MANILKRNNAEEGAGTASSFIDKTGENWYCKGETKKILFCKTVDDIIEGRAESFDFIRRENSTRRDKNAQGGSVERKKFVLFTLANNDKILVRTRGELK
jgi:hypothetical protein